MTRVARFGNATQDGPAILGLDVQTGKIVSVIRIPGKEYVGNLVIAAGHLIAQSPTEIVVYPLAKKP